MSNAYLLRAEGVYLDAVLGDTNQLSVVRGSGLMLRNAVKCLLGKLQNNHRHVAFKEVSRDASAVLIRFEIADDTVAQKIATTAVSHFREDYPDFTFVVDWIQAGQDFVNDQNRLLAANRLRQLQQPSLALPVWNQRKVGKPVCQVDGVRPVSGQKFRDKTVSRSVHNRFEFGREQRSRFYQDELGDTFDTSLTFTEDLQTLAGSHSYGNLNNKIAVIYLDGNSFGSIQSRYARTAEQKHAFDNEVTLKHRDFLEDLLNMAHQDKKFWTDAHQLRLEVLLWGGDEILLVVPAWCGLEVLQWFYQCVDGWTYKNERMTYSGGMVFSQAKTPSYRLTCLAKALAESIKSAQASERGNYFDYMVLESMDYPSEAIHDLRRRQYHQVAADRQYLQPLSQEGIRTLAQIIQSSDFPKSKLVELARAYVLEGEAAANTVKQRITHVIDTDNMVRVESHIKHLFRQPQAIWNWMHLAELWDYLLVERKAK